VIEMISRLSSCLRLWRDGASSVSRAARHGNPPTLDVLGMGIMVVRNICKIKSIEEHGTVQMGVSIKEYQQKRNRPNNAIIRVTIVPEAPQAANLDSFLASMRAFAFANLSSLRLAILAPVLGRSVVGFISGLLAPKFSAPTPRGRARRSNCGFSGEYFSTSSSIVISAVGFLLLRGVVRDNGSGDGRGSDISTVSSLNRFL
jgi:hypothetical protein